MRLADLEIFVIGLLDVEAQGASFVYRTGPSFQRTRGGISESSPLEAEQLYARRAARGRGLVVLGSYVGASTRQFERLLELPEVEPIELSVTAVLDPGGRDAHVAEVAQKAGVSEATVSRVHNAKPSVSHSTRQAVLTALDLMGY